MGQSHQRGQRGPLQTQELQGGPGVPKQEKQGVHRSLFPAGGEIPQRMVEAQASERNGMRWQGGTGLTPTHSSELNLFIYFCLLSF